MFKCMASSAVTDSVVPQTPVKMTMRNKYVVSDQLESPKLSKRKRAVKMRKGEVTMNESTDAIMSSNSSFETLDGAVVDSPFQVYY